MPVLLYTWYSGVYVSMPVLIQVYIKCVLLTTSASPARGVVALTPLALAAHHSIMGCVVCGVSCVVCTGRVNPVWG